jgi:hypothetical protein
VACQFAKRHSRAPSRKLRFLFRAILVSREKNLIDSDRGRASVMRADSIWFATTRPVGARSTSAGLWRARRGDSVERCYRKSTSVRAKNL